jgi:predicted DsbA family dithiol-disulfide isomerase
MQVEIWSDVVCPWCYIGKRNFEAALAQFEDRDDVRVTYRSFELNPDSPSEYDGDLADYISARFGRSREDALVQLESMTERMVGAGIDSHFDKARGGNTRDAHRLLHLANHHGIQEKVKECLMKAYFTEGEPIGSTEALQRVAVDAGLPADEVADLLAGDRFASEVDADIRLAQGFGIGGVPFFVVDRAYGASGAQPPEALLELLRRAKAGSHGGSERTGASPRRPTAPRGLTDG